MLNIEKYKDEILKVMKQDSGIPAVNKKGEFCLCNPYHCDECKWQKSSGNCATNFINWCLEEEVSTPRAEKIWMGMEQYTCPNCGTTVSGKKVTHYCYNCGQKLEWR